MTLLPAPQTATETPREVGGQVPPQAPRPSSPHRLQVSVILFAALFGTLLASYPARNLDFWQHLASGRDLLRGSGNPDQSWLYNIGLYGAYSVGGGALLVALKALLCGAVAALMMHLTRPAGWRVALAVTGLAVLAVGSRVLLQPATISIFFLALTFWLLQLNQADQLAEMRYWPGWRLVVLFVIWANVDARFVLGLGVVALAWIGRWLDGGLSLRRLGSVAAALGVLVVVSCISPEHVKGYRILPELRSGAS
ncbi:MAG TPA: hypothetical protein VLM40_10620, partial [Gemmata sp.]|nr:hypothetical protein [Gemmata sp.]